MKLFDGRFVFFFKFSSGPWLCSCITVKFQRDKPLSVALSQTLVLEALVNKSSEERVKLVEWLRAKEDGTDPVRLKQITDLDFTDLDLTNTSEQQPFMLTVPNVTKKDYGRYTVKITDQEWLETVASQVVREIGELGPDWQ